MRTVLLILLFGFSAAEACLEIPKVINLQNSPFPFSSFKLTSDRFEYVTPDGMVNTLRCQQQKEGYAWGIATTINGTTTEYGYDDIRSAGAILADSNEPANKTPLAFSDSAGGATAQLTKQTGKSAIELNCKVVGNIMSMDVTVSDNSGRSIANVRAAKMVGTRSLGMDQPQASTPVIDFSSSRQQTIEFAGCGVSPTATPGSSVPPSSTPTDQ